MKELSKEEKAQAYDKAVEIISDYYQKIKYSSISSASSDREVLEKAFPQLKESEDEKIRKHLFEYFKERKEAGDIDETWYGISYDKILSWLEKQGEPKPSSKMQVSENLYEHIRNTCACIDDALSSETVSDITDFLSMAERSAQSAFDMIEKQCEQKNVGEIAKEVCKDKESAVAFLKSAEIMNEKGELAEQYRQDEQKPTNEEMKIILQTEYEKGRADAIAECQKEWSEEDGSMLYSVMETEQYMLDVVNGVKKFDVGNDDIRKACAEELNWLQDLKNRALTQPKQEWSEDDESMYTRCVGILGKCYMGNLPTEVEEELNWFKSLKNRYTWKPSDEQILALRWVLNNVPYCKHKEEISGLLDQIKEF